MTCSPWWKFDPLPRIGEQQFQVGRELSRENGCNPGWVDLDRRYRLGLEVSLSGGERIKY
jgi:hypothetical protein